MYAANFGLRAAHPNIFNIQCNGDHLTEFSASWYQPHLQRSHWEVSVCYSPVEMDQTHTAHVLLTMNGQSQIFSIVTLILYIT